MTLDDGTKRSTQDVTPLETAAGDVVAPATRAAAKKTAAKKTPAKKTAAKKTAAKKPAAKKAPAKTTAVKKAPAKKTSVAKSPAKKAVAPAPVPDVAEAPPASEPPTPLAAPAARRWLSLAVAALVLALMAATAYAWVELRSSRAEVERLEQAAVTETEVLEQARAVALALTTYDYRDLPAQQRLLAELSTEAFQEKFASTNESLGPVFERLEATAKGTIVDAAVQQVRGDLATVLVLADQEAGSKQNAKPSVQASRLRLQLLRYDDRWLLDSVDLL